MISTSRLIIKASLLLGLLIFGAVRAQQPGVDCEPVQGQGWQGCAPTNPAQRPPQGQQPQAPQPPPQRWIDHWGAIATDGPGGSFGSATNMLSQDGAQNTALADCHAKKGASNCKVEIAYRNGCTAFAAGDTGHNAKAGATTDIAIQAAMKVCSAADTNCKVYYSACSVSQRIQ